MIRQKVVLVVGAGASAEFNFPTGDTLKHSIADAVRFSFEFGQKISGSEDLFRSICNHSTVGSQRDEYLLSGNELASTLDTFPSIDEALHYWSDRGHIVELGKAAIYMAILTAERESSLSREARNTPARWHQNLFEETWLWHFLTLAISGARKLDVAQIFDQVTIINFNYDRAVEFYLHRTLQAKAALTLAEASGVMAHLNIIRPYGSLGPLDWQKGGGTEFGGVVDNYFDVAPLVRTYTEQNRDVASDEAIRTAITEARLIVFLGFGFHSQNLAILSSNTRSPSPRRAFGTVLGIDPDNYQDIAVRLRSIMQADDLPILSARKAGQLLKDLRPTISALVG